MRHITVNSGAFKLKFMGGMCSLPTWKCARGEGVSVGGEWMGAERGESELGETGEDRDTGGSVCGVRGDVRWEWVGTENWGGGVK